MRKGLIILIALMLVLPLASARELSEDEIQKIRADAKSKLNQIKSFQIDVFTAEISDPIQGVIAPEKRVIIRYKSPNYYKEFLVNESGEPSWYHICNADKWEATYSDGFVKKGNLVPIWEMILRFFGMGACTAEARERLIDILPIRVLDPSYIERLDVIVEEEIFENNPVIKVTVMGKDKTIRSSYWIDYFDKTSLLKVAHTKVSKSTYINNEGVVEQSESSITTYFNIKVNQEIALSEFDLLIPKGAQICEQDYAAGIAAENKRSEIIERSHKQNRLLTEYEFNQTKALADEAAKAFCKASAETRTYKEYLDQASSRIQ